MADLPRIEDVLRAQTEANDLMLASVFRRTIRCAGCGIVKETRELNGMAAGHELRDEGWVATRPGADRPEALCPECSLF